MMSSQTVVQSVQPFDMSITGARPVLDVKAWPKVSIILVNYNGREYLGECLVSLWDQEYADFEVILVDNGSSDGSAEYVEREFEKVKLIVAGENLGFGGANNLAAQQAEGEYLAFLNPDTTVEPDWLPALIRALESNPKVGLATPKILILSQPDRINTCGNEVHFTGVPACRGWMLPRGAMNQTEQVCSVSGAAFVIRRSLFEEIGGFDEGFFLYAEDNDLSWRAQLAGYRCLYVPEGMIYHEYTPRFGPEKYYYLERNRYRMMLKNLRWRTLLLLLPALILAEVVTWGYALLQGRDHVFAKLRTYGWLVSHWGKVVGTRRETERRRRVLDKDILRRCSYRMAYGLASDGRTARVARLIFDPLFLVLYRAGLAIIRW